MHFTKLQGTGNDFVLVETSDSERNWSRVAIAVCDRHYGIGADGLLLLMPSDKADFRMRIFNTDGTEAEACGNGIRCLAKHVLDRGLAANGAKEITVETLAGVRTIRFQSNNKHFDKPVKFQVAMGAPGFAAQDIPAVLGKGKVVDIKSMLNYSITVGGKELSLNLVSMGNAHAVYFSEPPVSNFPLSQLGPKVEKNKAFPKGVNFEVARVVSRKQIEARVWEKGVGETLACGSGACAITVAAQLHGDVDNKVDVKLPGGTLSIEWDGRGEVFLSGPAETVFAGEWSPNGTII